MNKSDNNQPQNKVVSQRFEAKYPMTETMAQVMLASFSSFVEPDPRGDENCSYPLSSLYLDSPGLCMYWSSGNGEKNRIKLRVRSYSDDPNEPLFFEIKRRMNGIVMKQRAVVHRDYLQSILEQGEVLEKFLVNPSNHEMENLCQFRDLMESMEARPRVTVRYQREAYLCCTGEPVRVTFDRDLAYLPSFGQAQQVRLNGSGWIPIQTPVVMEVKFTNTFPFWIQELVQRHDLSRQSFAKYLICVDVATKEGLVTESYLPMEGATN